MLANKYFMIEELVSPQVYNEYGDFAVTAIDNRLLSLLDVMRDYFGVLIINDWLWNKKDNIYKYSGLRTMIDENYRVLSQHSFGRAVDIKSTLIDYAQIYNVILEKKSFFISNFLTGVEDIKDTNGWVHITVGNYPQARGRLAIIPNNRMITFI